MVAQPVIDIGPLVGGDGPAQAVAEEIDRACRSTGFFYVVGHGVDRADTERLERAARSLFALPEAVKEAMAMRHAGAAWRGWFPLHGELTSGSPDDKEGWYFGAELGPDDPRVRRGVPLHGANLFPAEVPELRDAVLGHLASMTALGQALLGGMALALGLQRTWFVEHLTADPLVLFRIFRYPPRPAATDGWGVAEHTDYGLLTLLLQDDSGGLEVRTPTGWVAAPPVPDSFVCNLGDMLERLTGGRYRSTPHRVRNTGGHDRLSFPFFLDPGWDTDVVPLPLDVTGPAGPRVARWDGSDPASITGTYGDYLTSRLGKVFPGLAGELG